MIRTLVAGKLSKNLSDDSRTGKPTKGTAMSRTTTSSNEMNPAEALFWDCVAQLYEIDGVVESTMFGFGCLRVEGQFVAMPADDSLWVKLPKARVESLIDSGVGEVCAPNGRPFREWVGVRRLDEATWMNLLRDSIDFVRP